MGEQKKTANWFILQQNYKYNHIIRKKKYSHRQNQKFIIIVLTFFVTWHSLNCHKYLKWLKVIIIIKLQ